MKTHIIALSLFMVVAGLYGQERNEPGKTQAPSRNQSLSPEDQAGKEAERAAVKLGLDDQQKSQWREAAMARIKATEPARAKLHGSTTPEERRLLKGELRQHGKQFDARVEAILSPDQKQRYAAWKESRKQRMRKHRHPGSSDQNEG